jgi:Agrobacterium tumefaciens protein Atu4866
MRIPRGMRIDTIVLGAATLLALIMGSSGTTPTRQLQFAPAPVAVAKTGAAAYAGIWLSADDTVRLDLSADLTYERSIVGRRATAIGTYAISGDTLELHDSSGLRTTATSIGGRLEMAGYRLSRI